VIKATRFNVILEKFVQAFGGLINKRKIVMIMWNISSSRQGVVKHFYDPNLRGMVLILILGHSHKDDPFPHPSWKPVPKKLTTFFSKFGGQWFNPTGHLVLLKVVLWTPSLYFNSPWSQLQWGFARPLLKKS